MTPGNNDARRLWYWVRARWGDLTRDTEPDTDPEALLDRAQREMQEMHAKNRQRAVQAITHKNELERAVGEARERVAQLQTELESAESEGNVLAAMQLRGELRAFETELAHSETLLVQAVEAAQAVKNAIRSEEETIQRKTAEALSLKAQWRSAQLENVLNRSQEALEALRNVEGASDGAEQTACLREAIHAKEMLRLAERDLTTKVATLREKVALARRKSDENKERELLRELEQYEAALETTQTAWGRAEAIVEQMRVGLGEESDRGTIATPAPARIVEPFSRSEKIALVSALVLVVFVFIVLLSLL